MLGSDLVNLAPKETRILSHDLETNITNLNTVEGALKADRPDGVINAVAFTNVDGAEKEPGEAFLVNGKGPEHLAVVCAELDIPLIQISTDFVFDGNRESLYTEEDRPTPLSKYGESKLAGETSARRWVKHYILRTSSLYGTGRDNHAARVLKAIKNKEKINVATDLFCSPTFTGDLARWIYQLIEKKPPYGTYHVCHTGFCSRYDFAARICELKNVDPSTILNPITMESLHLPARRPLHACLSMNKWEKQVGALLSWQDGLENYLSAL